MKALANFGLVVLSAACSMANTVVEFRSYLQSSPDPCFTVLKNGKHASEMPVKLYEHGTSPGRSPYWTSFTNNDGIACPPELPDGKYEIYVISGRRSAELDIEVSKKNEVSGFEMSLLLPDQLRTAASAPVATWVHEFRGVVEDATGAVIPKVKIEVLRKEPLDEMDENLIVETHSNERGEFSCYLKSGVYVAMFEIPGFNTAVFPFEVAQKGWGGLKLTMQVADANRTAPRIAELNAKK